MKRKDLSMARTLNDQLYEMESQISILEDEKNFRFNYISIGISDNQASKLDEKSIPPENMNLIRLILLVNAQKIYQGLLDEYRVLDTGVDDKMENIEDLEF